MIVNELDRCDMGGPFLIEDLRLITSQSCWSLGPREPATLTLPCLVSPLYLQGALRASYPRMLSRAVECLCWPFGVGQGPSHEFVRIHRIYQWGRLPSRGEVLKRS